MTSILSALMAIGLAAAAAGAGESPVRKHWYVRGQVQGVGFRAFTHDAARELKLKGWVRNLTDGRVEIVAEGPPKTVDELLAKVKKGPRGSRVADVTEGKVDEKEKLATEFEIRDTASAPKG